MSTADLALLQRWVHSRDAEAFAEIVARYSGMVYATCRRILRNPEDAEDVTQECFLRLARGQTDVHSSLAGWLHYLATHRSLDLVRSQSSRKKREATHAATQTDGGDIGWAAVEACVDEAIAALPEELRDPLVQHFFTGAKHEEIAERMGVTRSAVTRRIARGVEMVRMHLADRGMLVGAAVLASLLPLSAGAQVPPSLAASLGKLAVAGTAGGPLPAAALHTQTPPAQERLAGATLTHSAASSGPGLGAFSSAVLKTAAALALATLLYLGWHALKGSPETAEPLPPAADEYLLQQR